MLIFKKGFTLAEVLITLLIIGVVASMIIPSLISSTNNTESVTALKKVYSDLSQATQLIMMDNGGTIEGQCEDYDHNCLKSLYASHMAGIKDCNITLGGICWHNSNQWYDADGNPITGAEENQSALISSNGTFMVFINDSKTCISSFDGLKYPLACGRIRVDLNGFKKPNKVSKDIFDIYIFKNKLVPRGTENDTATCSGWGCTAKVLSENTINY
jgi:prepilin-type N-terminal cleavage/methylation domain-containing protein